MRGKPLFGMLVGAGLATLAAILANPLELERTVSIPLAPVLIIFASLAIARLTESVRDSAAYLHYGRNDIDYAFDSLDESPVTGTAPAAAPPAEPEIDRKQIDRADFCVFTPPTVAPNTEFVLSVWAFLRERRAEMLELASAGGAKPRGWLGPLHIERGAELSLVLQLKGFTIDSPVGTLFWDGDIANTSFLVAAPPALLPRTYPGALTILQGDVPLGRLMFEIAVGATAAKKATDIETRLQRITNAFASYASADRLAVLSRVQGIRAAGVNVFLDVLTLRAGDDWEQRIATEIDRCDALYLFWSEAARVSNWVDFEWRLALENRGSEFIWPVPLADPRDVPPPPELASAHFNDAILLLLNSEQARHNRP